MNVAEAKELIAELAPMLEAGTIEDIEHHIRLMSEAATMVAASLHCAELLNESHVEQLKPIKLQDAPRDGSPVIVETRMGQALLVHWQSSGGDGQWVSQGAALTDISLTRLCLPISPWPAATKDGDS